jgi:hypothetical protein
VTSLPNRGLYSEQSRRHLRRKASALVAAIELHTTAVIDEPLGLGNPSELSELNQVVRSAVAQWEDAVFRHTGTFPVGVDFDEDDEHDQA